MTPLVWNIGHCCVMLSMAAWIWYQTHMESLVLPLPMVLCLRLVCSLTLPTRTVATTSGLLSAFLLHQASIYTDSPHPIYSPFRGRHLSKFVAYEVAVYCLLVGVCGLVQRQLWREARIAHEFASFRKASAADAAARAERWEDAGERREEREDKRPRGPPHLGSRAGGGETEDGAEKEEAAFKATTTFEPWSPSLPPAPSNSLSPGPSTVVPASTCSAS